mmetsp:Transcript_31212/g.71874  ORF Transcript_31212/g.71874 Transcript_31212/m.71874 type:complete len:86 (+) Transcript_31212:59-316(+)
MSSQQQHNPFLVCLDGPSATNTEPAGTQQTSPHKNTPILNPLLDRSRTPSSMPQLTCGARSVITRSEKHVFACRTQECRGVIAQI